MKMILSGLSFLIVGYLANAQQTEGGQNNAINPTTNQFQNGNQQGWESSSYSIEASNLPSILPSNFKREYPDQPNVEWYGYESGYIATYRDSNKMWHRVIYTKNGTPNGMATQIPTAKLPPSVTSYMNKNYSDTTYHNVYEVTSTSGEKSYQVNANGKWMAFDSEGHLQPVR